MYHPQHGLRYTHLLDQLPGIEVLIDQLAGYYPIWATVPGGAPRPLTPVYEEGELWLDPRHLPFLVEMQTGLHCSLWHDLLLESTPETRGPTLMAQAQALWVPPEAAPPPVLAPRPEPLAVELVPPSRTIPPPVFPPLDHWQAKSHWLGYCSVCYSPGLDTYHFRTRAQCPSTSRPLPRQLVRDPGCRVILHAHTIHNLEAVKGIVIQLRRQKVIRVAGGVNNYQLSGRYTQTEFCRLVERMVIQAAIQPTAR